MCVCVCVCVREREREHNTIMCILGCHTLYVCPSSVFTVVGMSL